MRLPETFFLRALHAIVYAWLSLLLSTSAYAQIVPGPADVSRVKPEEKKAPLNRSEDQKIQIPSTAPKTAAPDAAKNIHFVLKDVRIEGMTVFSQDAVKESYTSSLDKEVMLEFAWVIADALTKRYRDAGYFLSRAYVPAQEVKDGIIVIKVVEGYIGKVELNDPMAERYVVKQLIASVLQERPAKAQSVESFLLRMNDLPGVSLRAVLSTMENGESKEGAVKLVLEPTKEKGKGSVTFDNFGSRFLGPHELSVDYQTSLLPLQQTSFSLLSSLPTDELKYVTLVHTIPLTPRLTLELNGGITKANPGYTLEAFDVDSKSTSLSAALAYQWIRQREENLALKLKLDARNTDSDLLGTPFVRDRIRALRGSLVYDDSDAWHGTNAVNLTLSKGLEELGANDEGDANLSRAEAEPDFTKFEFSLTRLQALSEEWSLLGSVAGQWADGPLYSSEEFGYGGQAFGRAYDSSEITGDHGLAGSLELRYGQWGNWQPLSLTPYIFYDIGKVWNEDTGARDASGSSAGFGTRFSTFFEISGNIGVAFPLNRDIATPIYGGNPSGPRFSLQISKEF